MTQPWWGKEAKPHKKARLGAARGTPYSQQPELLPASRQTAADEVRARIRDYTPEWTNYRPTDAGAALVRLFGEQAEPVLQRLNLLPKKSFIEFLNLTGVSPLPATSAVAMLEFTVSEGAPRSVLVPRGFQAGARPAAGEGEMIVFETEFRLYAAPNKIAKAFVQEGGLFSEVEVGGGEEGATFDAFGGRPIPGRALYLGLSGEVAPAPSLSLGVAVAPAAGTPPPVPSGGLTPVPVAVPPVLRWEVQDGTSFRAVEVVRDETGGLARSGVVELRLPRRWRKGKLGVGENEEELRWLRLLIVHGQYARSPRLSFVKLNMTRAVAARTIHNEVLEHVPNTNNRQMRLSQSPVLPGTLVLEVDDGGATSALEGELAEIPGPRPGQLSEDEDLLAQEAAGGVAPFGRRWRAVESLLDFGPDAEVFVLDAASGVVTFGDNRHGAAVPPGFRNVRAASYRVGGGAAGAVEAEAVSVLLSSAAFVTGVKNPLPASGGADTESRERAMSRGPQEFRARGRAVTVADYALMAMRAPGAQVERAHAVSGLHPALPGRPLPGVVGVFVVPPDRGEGPPSPDEASLRAVAEFLSEQLAPAGVQIIAAAPRFHRIRAAVSVVVDRAVDPSDAVRRVLEELDRYLHPLKGGEEGAGWPFGGAVRHAALVRTLLANVHGLLAVPLLNLIVDGVRTGGCTDFTPDAHALFWPEGHEVVALEPEEEG